jgi:excisionase family DNA binding protein
MEPLLTLEEAADLLKLSKSQMYELTRTRSRCRQRVPLPVVRIGKHKMFRASSLNEWINQLEQQAR